MNIQELQSVITHLEERKQLNDSWLLKNYANPYRTNIHRDNRELEVQINTKRRTLENLRCGYPSHGYELPEDSGPFLNVNINKK